MQAVLELDLVWRILALCSIPIVFALLLQWVTHSSPIAGFFQNYVGVQGPYFVSVAILFALFSTFLGADIWNRVRHSDQSLEHETAALQSLRQIAITQGDNGVRVEQSLNNYIETSLAEEWASDDRGRSAVVDKALERLVTDILNPQLSTDDHRTAQGAMLESYRDIRRARAERLHVAGSHSDPYKWAAVVMLGLLTQVAIALVHFENRKAQSAALLVFTMAFCVTLTALAAHESPLADLELISPEPMQRLRK